MTLRYLTAGESHGPGHVVILEGMPSGLKISADDINKHLRERQGGYGRGGRMKIEQDAIEILSGIRRGMTLGSPIALIVHNKDWANWAQEMSIEPTDVPVKRPVYHPRPGHADLAGALKYGEPDMRNILERSSARETVMRVAAGAVARRLLEAFDIDIVGHVISIGSIESQAKLPKGYDAIRKQAAASELRCLDPKATAAMKKMIDQCRKDGDSLGGIFEIRVAGAPPGLGSHVQWDRKLDGRLAQSLMGLNAMKGVEMGMGFESARLTGSQVHDQIFYDAKKKRFYHDTNRAGGIEGGMTNGEEIVIRVAQKPIATLTKPLQSVDIRTKEAVKASVERSDIVSVPAGCVIGEALVALVIADAFLDKFGGDSIPEIRRNVDGYLKQLKEF